ncbi:MAG: S8 family peptidase [Flavobacteriales bacterium]|nr:S8 family peptidase [Flavobacteriales bacterium]
MLRFSVSLLAFSLLGVFAPGQSGILGGVQLQHFLSAGHGAHPELDLLLRGQVDLVSVAVVDAGGRVKWSMEGIIGATVPTEGVRALFRDERIQGVEFSLYRGSALNDSMRVKARVDRVHGGEAPLLQAYQGQGVIVALIDAGLDLTHPDFQLADGRTRVLRYWDQTLPVDAQFTPQPYGYGQAFDSTAINAGGCPSVDQPDWFGHGSTVTGTAAGNGLANGRHRGVAPEADLIIVSSDFDRPNWKASVADAVDYILNEADALGMPVVINASLGDYMGSHDGLDAAALFIDDRLQQAPGRAMVCAAGNSRGVANYHLRGAPSADTSFTWFRVNQNSLFGYPALYFELWADTAEMHQVQFAMGGDRIGGGRYRLRGNTPFHGIQGVLGQLITDTLWSLSGNRLGVVQYFAELRGEQYRMDVFMPEPDSINGYWYRFMTAGTGGFDVWSGTAFGTSQIVGGDFSNFTEFPDSARYGQPDTFMRTVDSWACSDKVITVANYQNELAYFDVNNNWLTFAGTEEELSPGSSNGPTRDGRMKPDVAATGDITLSSAPLDLIQFFLANDPEKVAQGGFHIRGGGTSIASPVVAGTVALLMERCPMIEGHQIVSSIHDGARNDSYTGPVPNVDWGYGKLDAFATLLAAGPDMSLVADTTICSGDSVAIDAPMGLVDLIWSNGSTMPMVFQSASGSLSVEGTNSAGCFGRSDTLEFIEVPTPGIPVIMQQGNVLSTGPATSYQWMLDGSPVPDADQQELEALTSGTYQVMIEDENGCYALSDPLLVVVTGTGLIQEQARFRVWPVPADQQLWIELDREGPARVTLMTIEGRAVRSTEVREGNGAMLLDVQQLASGSYLLVVEVQGGRRSVPVIIR